MLCWVLIMGTGDWVSYDCVSVLAALGDDDASWPFAFSVALCHLYRLSVSFLVLNRGSNIGG